VLLAGSASSAQAALLETFAEAGEKIHHFRSGKSCKVWLVAKVRNRLMKQGVPKAAEAAQGSAENPPSATSAGLNPQAAALAEEFCKIPEPGRSALALLYLDHFSTLEIAQILQMTTEELSDASEAARAQLRGSGAATQAPQTAEEQGPIS